MSRSRHTDSYFAATALGAAPGASLGAIEHPRLLGAVACDVCVIGGGFTGLSTALHLAERSYDVVLLEARRTGWGASGRNSVSSAAASASRKASSSAWSGRRRRALSGTWRKKPRRR